MFKLTALLLVLPALALCSTKYYRNDLEPKDFSSHKLIQIKPSSLDQTNTLRNLEVEFELEFWNDAQDDLRPVLTLVDPQRADFFNQLNRSSINYSIVAHNFQTMVNREREQMSESRFALAKSADFDYDNTYHPYEEIVSQLKYLAQSNQNNIKAEYFSVGKTYEGRDIPAIKFGTGKAIFIECGIHSREWVSVAFCLWTANQLLNTAAIKHYSENFEYVIVPVLNVDGYVTTHTTDRMWRKTRSRNPSSSCLGADPNRNWDTAFCQKGASSNPCSETYCGQSAFSEVEAKQMSVLAAQYKGNMAAYFAVHSYSQYWMHPWGYTYSLPGNSQELASMCKVASSAIQKVHGKKFTTGSIANVIYLASGSSIDWVYDTLGTKVAFAIEMRDTGEYGFMLPANQIKPACEETWAGVKAVIEQLS